MTGPAVALPAATAEDEARPPVVVARSLYRFYRSGDEETLALQGVSLTVHTGEMVAVTGPSGSGKSTLLACLSGMDNPDGGSVHITGRLISHQPEPHQARLRARAIGILFQNRNLLDHLTVTQNLVLVQRLARRSVHRTSRPGPAAILASVDLADRAGAYPHQLSGGELARAGLAIALANAPAVLLADEPTGELDTATEAHVLDLLSAAAERGAAVVIASHSPAVAATAHRILRLADGKAAAGQDQP